MIYASLMLEKFPNKGLDFFLSICIQFVWLPLGVTPWAGEIMMSKIYFGKPRLWALLGGLSTWSCGCCACRPLPRAISVLAMSKDNPAILPRLHILSNLGSTLNFQRRSDTNNSVCRLFNRGLQCKFGKNFKYSHRCTKCNGNHPITNCRLNT